MTESKFISDLQMRWRAGYGAVVIPTQEQLACYALIQRAVVTLKPTEKDPDVPALERWSVASGSFQMEADGGLKQLVSSSDVVDHFKVMMDQHTGKARRCFILAGIPDLDDPVTERNFLELIWWARSSGHLLCLVQPSAELPATLKSEVAVIEHPLPSRDELKAIVKEITSDRFTPGEVHIDNLSGLTSIAAQNAVAMALCKASDTGETELDAVLLRTLKEGEISKRSYLQVISPKITMDDLCGHDLLKTWVSKRRRIFSEAARDAGLPTPKGMALVGPPGTGKTRMAEAMAGTCGMSLVLLDMGAVKSSYVGESEANLADALKVAEACSPCILLIDEVERSISTGDRDGGVSEALLGKLLTWAATKTASVFLFLTSNYPQRLPPALIRKGRLDEIFFLDLPSVEERKEIWAHYLNKAGVTACGAANLESLAGRSEGWSGAEIEACVNECRVRSFNDNEKITEDMVREEIQDLRPLSQTMSKDVEEMRAWGASNAKPTVRSNPVVNKEPMINVPSGRKVSA